MAATRAKAWRLGYTFNKKAWDNWDNMTPEERQEAEDRYEKNTNANSGHVIYE